MSLISEPLLRELNPTGLRSLISCVRVLDKHPSLATREDVRAQLQRHAQSFFASPAGSIRDEDAIGALLKGESLLYEGRSAEASNLFLQVVARLGERATSVEPLVALANYDLTLCAAYFSNAVPSGEILKAADELFEFVTAMPQVRDARSALERVRRVASLSFVGMLLYSLERAQDGTVIPAEKQLQEMAGEVLKLLRPTESLPQRLPDLARYLHEVLMDELAEVCIYDISPRLRLTARIVRGKQYFYFHQLPQAREEIEALLNETAAKQLNLPVIYAQGLEYLARIEDLEGRTEAAERFLREAIDCYKSANCVEQEASAQIALANIYSRKYRTDLGDRLLAQACRALERIGHGSASAGRARAAAMRVSGIGRLYAGQYLSAVRALEEAGEVDREVRWGPGALEDKLHSAIALARFGKFQEAEQLTRTLEISTHPFDTYIDIIKSIRLRILALVQLAACTPGERSAFEGACRYFEEACNVFARLLPGNRAAIFTAGGRLDEEFLFSNFLERYRCALRQIGRNVCNLSMIHMQLDRREVGLALIDSAYRIGEEIASFKAKLKARAGRALMYEMSDDAAAADDIEALVDLLETHNRQAATDGREPMHVDLTGIFVEISDLFPDRIQFLDLLDRLSRRATRGRSTRAVGLVENAISSFVTRYAEDLYICACHYLHRGWEIPEHVRPRLRCDGGTQPVFLVAASSDMPEMFLPRGQGAGVRPIVAADLTTLGVSGALELVQRFRQAWPSPYDRPSLFGLLRDLGQLSAAEQSDLVRHGVTLMCPANGYFELDSFRYRSRMVQDLFGGPARGQFREPRRETAWLRSDLPLDPPPSTQRWFMADMKEALLLWSHVDPHDSLTFHGRWVGVKRAFASFRNDPSFDSLPEYTRYTLSLLHDVVAWTPLSHITPAMTQVVLSSLLKIEEPSANEETHREIYLAVRRSPFFLAPPEKRGRGARGNNRARRKVVRSSQRSAPDRQSDSR